MIFDLLYRPGDKFAELKDKDVLGWAVVVLIFRWFVTSVTTVSVMYVRRSPMLFKPPWGIDPNTYRYYEIFWYGPVGIAIMLIITWVIAYVGRRFHNQGITFRKTFQIVSLSFFFPWLPCIPGDYLLAEAVNARPAFLVPFHILILGLCCLFTAIGFHKIYDLTVSKSAVLAAIAGGIFIVLAGAVMR